MKLFNKLFFGFALGAGLLAPALASAQISEPDTIFYGQVINRTTAQLDLITAGNLVWTILRPDGKPITLSATLQPLNNGQFSYRLAVPHQALTFGLVASDATVPLTPSAAICSHLLISVDGIPATIIAPGSSSFNVAQILRAATYRLDLELANSLGDTAGDGIPDWWKAKYGITDPNADNDNDGWSNLQEFRNGGDPNKDNKIPTLSAAELWAYADGLTAIHLDAVDSDSATVNLYYTLTTLPANGTFYLHNLNGDGSFTDVPLPFNGFFTQDDVNQGKLIFVHNGTNAPATTTSFTVNLRDENPAHTTNYVVTLNLYRPNYSDAVNQSAQADAAAPVGCPDVPGLTFGEQQMLINYFLSRDHGYILADSARTTGPRTVKAASAGVNTSQDRPYVLMGGAGNDRLVGGTFADILIGGRGTNSLRGNGGADLFIIADTNSASETIEDFSATNGDVLDISRVLQGASLQLTNYVQLTTVNTNSILAINFAGSASGYTNLLIKLAGTQFGAVDLKTLANNGNLLAGNKVMSPSVSIVASLPAASQNGTVSGQFTLTRTGSTAATLTVNLTISGSAVNGSSYELISSPVTFAAGQRNLNLPVNPYLNSSTLSQVAQISIAAGTGYEAGSPASAQVSIEPLLAQITIEAIEPMATKADLTPGTFLISRAGIYSSSVLVRLTVSGTASSSTDYAPVSTFVNLAPNQTTALISITPKSTANVNGTARFVQLAIKPDATYKVMNPSVDRVYIVDQLFTGNAWQSRYFPGSSEDWTTFANRDTGNTGIKNLYRYAYGLNATSPSSTNGLPVFQIAGGHLCVTFRRPLAVTDLDYFVQVSDDLKQWSSLSNDVEPYTPVNANTNDVETVSFRGKAGVTSKSKQFMRVLLQPH